MFRELLKQSESEILDFKAEPHRIDIERDKSKFIKDILAMANTPREGCAYIIIGVKKHKDGSFDLLGVTEHTDDADLQSQLNLAKVTPKPSFIYQSLDVDGKNYGVLEIRLTKNGPFFATKDFGVLKTNKLYFRRGSQNDEATIEEQKNIYQWFNGNSQQQENSTATENLQSITKWNEFSRACHHFDKNRLYMFVVGQNSDPMPTEWKYLGRLPLSLVIDFDTESENQGVFFSARTELENNRSLHLITLDDEYHFVPDRACYWYGARGLQGRLSSLVNGNWREWNRKYGNSLQKLVIDFVVASDERPLTVVCLWYAPEYLRAVCSEVDKAFGDKADYVFACTEAESLSDLASQFDGTIISIKPSDVLYGISQNINTTNNEFSLEAGIPSGEGSFQIIDKRTLLWLSEDLDVLHSNIELQEQLERETGRDFLRGTVINWSDLSSNYDAERDVTAALQKKVLKDLIARITVRRNLYHWPGAGGTTIARRIAWNLRREHPTLILKHITPTETVSRFRELFKLSGQSMLALVEGADTMNDLLERLYNEIRAEHIPVVFLSVLRSNKVPVQSDRSNFLDSKLTLAESHRFLQAYKRIVPQKTIELERIHNSNNNQERTPFHFALAAFQKDFIGITNYVEARLNSANPRQREIIRYIALAYYYGHKELSAQIFAPHIGLQVNSSVRLENQLDELSLELLIQQENSKWRPVHQLVAAEILIVSLSHNTDRRNWKFGLFQLAIDFLKVCSKGVLIPSSGLIELIARIFILRDERDLLGTEPSGESKFSLLIEDIPTREERLSIFKTLVEEFPNEPHFWGHLGRFLSVEMKEYQEAITSLDHAIELSLDAPDPVLYHMKGMCYRQIAYSLMVEMQKRDGDKDISKLKEIVEKAKENFAEARSIDSNLEHGYISPAQLLLRVLDFGFNISGCASRAEFLVSASAGWYREQLDESENLLERARNIREGENPSRYVVHCQSNLDEIYDNYSRALEGWNNLLNRKDVFAPPIRRQIVRAYLVRSNRNWLSVPKNEIEKIVDLMEDNIREEPASDRNIRLWFQALRQSSRHDIDLALARLANWAISGDAIEAHFYLYVLHVLKAIEGSMVEQIVAQDLIKNMKQRSHSQRNRTRSHEWLGQGHGLSRLVNSSDLGEWDENIGFYSNCEKLTKVEGRVAKITGPESGEVELDTIGLKAFFVPGKADVHKGRDENVKVSFYLGFSYEGLRAWSVEKTK